MQGEEEVRINEVKRKEDETRIKERRGEGEGGENRMKENHTHRWRTENIAAVVVEKLLVLEIVDNTMLLRLRKGRER